MFDQLLAVAVTLAGYKAASVLAERFPRLQPLVVATICVWFAWWLIGEDWEAYRAGGEWISFWLGPATVALAVPLAKQLKEFVHIGAASCWVWRWAVPLRS